MNVRRQDTAADQAVLSEVVDDPVERALQEQLGIFDEDPVYLARREGVQGVQ